MALDFSPDTDDALSILVQRYNQGLPTAKQILSEADFVFALPAVQAMAGLPNTEIVVTVSPNSPRRGRIHIRYDRFALEDVVQGPTGWGEEITTLHALLPSLNAAYGLALQPEDVDDAPLALETETLTVKPTCLRYTGTLTFGPSTVLSLSDVLATTELSGFDFPS